jgi:predicted nucleotide-binding protein
VTKEDTRYVQYRTPRDNVIFELGLAIGSISRQRVLMVADRAVKLKIPADLFGITPEEFDMPQRGNLTASLHAVSKKLEAKIIELGLLTD